ncbi:hypothetical protein [Tateyamaria sp.]|uniref:hypothetical protein n=1 Tax=Tateyamaria sp. TaxID=1929288 RepID=UPI003B21DE83
MDGEAFAAYIREVLAPELEPGTVVICDNLATHKNVEAAAALREHGCWFLYCREHSELSGVGNMPIVRFS